MAFPKTNIWLDKASGRMECIHETEAKCKPEPKKGNWQILSQCTTTWMWAETKWIRQNIWKPNEAMTPYEGNSVTLFVFVQKLVITTLRAPSLRNLYFQPTPHISNDIFYNRCVNCHSERIVLYLPFTFRSHFWHERWKMTKYTTSLVSTSPHPRAVWSVLAFRAV